MPIALLLAVALSQAEAPAPRPSVKLGIFNLTLAGIDPALQSTAIDALASAASALPGVQVISRNELDAMLGAEKLKDNLGCNDTSCLAEIGLAAGVERVVAGSVSRVETELVVSLQLVNVQYATVENRTTITWPGGTTGLTDVLGAAAEQLLVPARERKPGAIAVTGIDAAASVSVDGQGRGLGPMEIDGLEVGVHKLRVEAPGFTPFEAPFVARMGGRTVVPVSLSAEAEKPFYAQWWFWGGAAVVVGGGVAAALLLGGGGGSDKEPSLASGSFTVPGLPGALSRSR